MIPKKNRLTRADFASLPPARRWQGAFFSLSASQGVNGHRKFSCVVSKKVSARAVTRNLIKRRARAAFGKMIPQIGSAQNFVLVAKSKSLGASYQEIERDIQALFSQART